MVSNTIVRKDVWVRIPLPALSSPVGRISAGGVDELTSEFNGYHLCVCYLASGYRFSELGGQSTLRGPGNLEKTRSSTSAPGPI